MFVSRLLDIVDLMANEMIPLSIKCSGKKSLADGKVMRGDEILLTAGK